MLLPPSDLDRLIVRNKTLMPLPKTLWQFIQSPILSAKEKMRILSECIAPSSSDIDQDDPQPIFWRTLWESGG